MATKVFIKPNDGRNVRLENGMLLPKDGMEVVRSSYIDRRILVGDAVESTSKPLVEKSSSEKKDSKSKT